MAENGRNNALNQKEKIESIRKLGQKLGFWTHGFGYPMHCKRIFRDIPLDNRAVLEIGCGKGLLCIWASIHGASNVIGLEPLVDGSGSFSSMKLYKEFKEMVSAADLQNIEIFPNRIEDFKVQDNYFDVVLMIASVNHIDEEKCIHLLDDPAAYELYTNVFRQVSGIMKKNGKIVLIDCSNRNFFGDLGIKNPFEKSIEWQKHQSPDSWAKLLSQCGFSEPKITWPSGRFLRYLGLSHRNKFFSYFLDSAFRLEMTCVKG